MKGERPAFVQVPIAGGGTMTAVVANRDGLAPVEINGVEHIGLLLSVNTASATIAVMTIDETNAMALRLVTAAATLEARLARKSGVMRRDVSNIEGVPTRLAAGDIGAELFQVFDSDGKPMDDVIEVDTTEDWLKRYVTDDKGGVIIIGEEYAVERIEGEFFIRRVTTDG